MWWIDIIFYAVLVLFAGIGLYKGFFNSLLSLIGSALAVGLAIWLARPAGTFINKFINVPQKFNKLLDKAFSEDAVTLFGSTVTKNTMSSFFSLLFAGIIVFILVKLGLWLLSKLFDSAVKNSTIGSGLNKVLGMLLGAVQGGVILISALALCSIVSGTGIAGTSIDDAISKAKTTNWVYKYVDDYAEKELSKIDMNKWLEKVAGKNKETEEEAPAEETPAVTPTPTPTPEP